MATQKSETIADISWRRCFNVNQRAKNSFNIFFLYKQFAKIQQKSFACIYVCILISPIYSLKNFHLRVEQSVPD
jgi:hypothetical protein